jgi:hypothetical protein
MHIQWRHEDGYLEAFVLEVLCLSSFFYYHHFAICRGNILVVVKRIISGWDTEKPNDPEP